MVLLKDVYEKLTKDSNKVWGEYQKKYSFLKDWKIGVIEKAGKEEEHFKILKKDNTTDYHYEFLKNEDNNISAEFNISAELHFREEGIKYAEEHEDKILKILKTAKYDAKWYSGKERRFYYNEKFADIDSAIEKMIELMETFENFKRELKMENKLLDECVNLLKANKNLILTGAPGTGKTYLAKEIAASMIGIDKEELEKSEQFEFVQFHPSYDYTDFVEGLRPTEPDGNGNIGFELKDGVFKEFCEKAKEKASMANLDAAIEKFKEECADNTVKVKNKRGYEFSVIYEGRTTFRVRSDKAKVEKYTSANIEYIKKLYQGIEIKNYGKTYVRGILEHLKNKYNVPEYQEDKSDKKYVFVIDEINRGEISKIFGELFFSIDPSYRGEKGAAKTQYSNMHDDPNEKFYVPENVYIIGTMNDIDRSVESFDFAMRRRFTWKEITAEESAKNMDLSDTTKNRMTNLNNAISSIPGLNSSYHIGGAYFLDREGNKIDLTDNVKRKDLWELRLKPLLFEYLRGTPNAEENLKKLEVAYNSETNENNGQ